MDAGFTKRLLTSTDSDPIEIDDLGSKVKVTVAENVSVNDEKNSIKIKF